MAQSNVIIDKLLADKDLAKKMAKDPAAVLKGLGVEPTPELVSSLKGLDPAELKRLATAFGQQKAAL